MSTLNFEDGMHGQSVRVTPDADPATVARALVGEALNTGSSIRRYLGPDALLAAAQVYATLAYASAPHDCRDSRLNPIGGPHRTYDAGSMPAGW